MHKGLAIFFVTFAQHRESTEKSDDFSFLKKYGYRAALRLLFPSPPSPSKKLRRRRKQKTPFSGIN